MILETINPNPQNYDDKIEDLSPDSKKLFINSTSPNDELMFKKRIKHEKNLKKQIDKSPGGLIKLH